MSQRIIVINRGDTFRFGLTIHDDLGEIYMLSEEDAVYFGLMDPNQMFENALVKKKYTKADEDSDGVIMIDLRPEDTLDLIPGVYYYSVKLHKVSTENNIDDVATIINKTKFIIND